MATRKSPASAEKKTTPRKAPARKAVMATEAAVAEKNAPSYHEVAQLAEQFWVERGRPYGSAEVDWLRAEATLYA